MAAALACAVLLAAAPAAADRVPVRAGVQNDVGRIVFDWQQPVRYTTTISDNELRIEFGRPIEADLRPLQGILAPFVSAARVAPDGRSAVFELTGELSVRDFQSGTSVVVDLATADVLDAAPLVGLPGQPAPDPSAVRRIRAKPTAAPGRGLAVPVRVGEHRDFSRLVFDWRERVDYGVEEDGGRVTVRFEADNPIDLDAFAKDKPPLIRSARFEPQAGAGQVTLEVDDGTRIRHFRTGTKVVLDVLGTAGKDKTAAEPEPEAAAKAAAKPAAKAPSAAEPDDPEPAAADAEGEGPPSPPAERTVARAPPPPVETAPAAVEPAAGSVPPPRVRVTDGEDSVTAEFRWSAATDAAVFRRAGFVWVVFDQPTELNLSRLRGAGGGIIGDVEQLPNRYGAIARLAVRPGYNPAVLVEGNTWTVELRGQPVVPQLPVGVRAESTEDDRTQLRVVTRAPGRPLRISDPEVGDEMIVVPLSQPGEGTETIRKFTDLAILPSAQGLVAVPRADGVRARLQDDSVIFSAPEGLFLTPQARAPAPGQGLDAMLVLDFKAWKGDRRVDFIDAKHKLNEAIANAPDSQRNTVRYDLVRFLFANNMNEEALAIMELIAEGSPVIARTAEFNLIRGAASLLIGRLDDAARFLEADVLRGSSEAAFWRAVLIAERGNPTIASEMFERLGPPPEPYPDSVRAPLDFIAARAALDADKTYLAAQLIEDLEGRRLSPAQLEYLIYLQGVLALAEGDRDEAVALWREARSGPSPQARAESEFALIKDGLLRRELDVGRAIDRLERLRYTWRGGGFEFDVMRALARLYIESDAYPEAFRLLRQALKYYPDHPDAPAARDELQREFVELFSQEGEDRLPPLTALGLFDEYRDLIPQGKAADKLIEHLADRLVAVDLLQQATDLLRHLIRFRLSGDDIARVGAREAVIHLLDRDPNAALEALDFSKADDMPIGLQDARDRVRARALIETDRGNEALILLLDDETREADLLRAALYLRQRDWPEAARQFEKLVQREAAPGDPLEGDVPRLVLNWAVAQALAGDRDGLELMRDRYGIQMARTDLREPFALLTSSTAEFSDIQEVAAQVSQAESFRKYLANLSEDFAPEG